MIKKVSLVGLGAMGIWMAEQLTRRMPVSDVRIIADEARIARYQAEGIYCNGQACDFAYVGPDAVVEPADLLIFATKFAGLEAALEMACGHVGEETTIISLLNGIASEERIGTAYGWDKVIYCVAQGMDAVKVGNRLTYSVTGDIAIGTADGCPNGRLTELCRFFDNVGFPYQVPSDMMRQYWGKFMLNVGLNQAVAVYETNYGAVQVPGAPRETMIAAMREVLPLAEASGIALPESDVAYWLDIVATLGAEGKPSLRQDMEAHRLSEVELFSGTVRTLGARYGIATPVNDYLYETIKAREANY